MFNSISNGWSKTVIISSSIEDDWGDADVTELYLDKIAQRHRRRIRAV